jgi:hypothetical protein
MKNFRMFCAGALILALVLLSGEPAMGQKKSTYPEDGLHQAEYTAHLRFLASDELMGRMTGSPWIDVAARYIAEQFRADGLATFPGMEGYFQQVPLQRRMPAGRGHIVILQDTLVQGVNMIMRNGGPLDWKGHFVFVGYGMVDSSKNIDDYKGLDVKGKVIVAKFGAADNTNMFASFSSIAEEKRRNAVKRGAMALIECYHGTRPWRTLLPSLSRTSLELGSENGDFPHFVVEDSTSALSSRAESQPEGPVMVQTEVLRLEKVQARNVIGFVKGSDPKLRDEYVLLTAHYDHLGTRRTNDASTDTIFNGARDNAVGTVALLAAARSFTISPPKRSVIIAAVTGEEIGEFGSRYLAANPPVPMNQIVFDLNTDGAGYDDTTIVTVVGLERTTAEAAINKGSERYGLKAIPDPVPEQNLFNRSDNVNFARQGVPAPTFSSGFRAFGAEILKYYHKAEDEANDSFNFSYSLKFYQAFVHSARLIADMNERPFWKPGDSYEKAGLKLYQK